VPQKPVMPSIIERVEHAHLDIRMPSERQDLLIARHRIAVVDQDPHPHTAVRGSPQLLGEEPSRGVAPKNKILQIERPLRRARELYASDESVDAGVDDVKAGLSFVTTRLVEKLPAERGLLRSLQGEGSALRGVGAAREARTARQRHR